MKREAVEIREKKTSIQNFLPNSLKRVTAKMQKTLSRNFWLRIGISWTTISSSITSSSSKWTSNSMVISTCSESISLNLWIFLNCMPVPWWNFSPQNSIEAKADSRKNSRISAITSEFLWGSSSREQDLRQLLLNMLNFYWLFRALFQ